MVQEMDRVGESQRLGSDYKDAKRNRRRAEILDAAAEVFAERGYFAATMQDIADLIGVRSASLYYYFSSKEAALEEVCRFGGEEFLKQLGRISLEGGSVLEIIQEGIRHHLDSRWRNYVNSFVFNRHNLPEGIRAEMDQIARDYHKLWIDILARGQRSGELSSHLDPRLAAGVVLAVCNGSIAFSEQEGLGSRVDEILEIVLDGVRQR